MSRTPPRADADTLLVRRTAIRVGVWITVAVTLLVIVLVVVAVSFVFRQIPLSALFDRNRHEEAVDVGGLDLIVGAIVLGVLAIVLAGTLGLLATRRAVAPLVEALGRQRRFVADASHELRTPLAILDARLQLLQRAMPASDPNAGLVDELRDDSRNVINVVSDLLDSVDVTTTGTVGPVAVAPVVADAVASMRILGDERQVLIESDTTDAEPEALIPEASLHRALVALIDNAVKHSPVGQVVTVTTGVERAHTVIAVTDHGAGIQGIHPDRVFDRFARSSLAVDGGGGASTGFGIGLSLVQDTLGRFGGTVEVASTSSTGTTITMRLPRPRR